MLIKGFMLMSEFWKATRGIWILGGLFGLLLWAAWKGDRDTKLYNAQRMEVVCPSFLSIARSARDTLIVMRNEPLCNSYVLDNLQ